MFGQVEQDPARLSQKIDTQTKLANTSTIVDQHSKSLRKSHLSSNFKNQNGTSLKLDDIDTLNFPLQGVYSIYTSDNGGYVTGNNGYGDLAKANKFVIPQACKITGILFDFYYATGGPADIEIAVWDNSGPVSAPGEIIGSTTVPLSVLQNDINNNQRSFIEFEEPITVTTTFYAGMILPTTAGDTLVVWSNTDGNTVPGIAWEQWSDQTWYAMFQNASWGKNLAMAIFPIVDYGPLPLMADFIGNPTHVQPGGSVIFTNLSTGDPTARLWTFEGGNPATSTESNVEVIYEEEGTYDVTLMVENDTSQDTKTVENYIVVEDAPIQIDTLNYPLAGTYAVYVSAENGYISGNNEFGDLAKANYYMNNQNLYITGILYEFAYSTGEGGNIEMAIWSDNGTNNSPGSKIAFKNVLYDNINNDIVSGDFTFVEFEQPVLVNSSFYAGFVLPQSTGDTLVVWSNENNDINPGIAWELWNENVWYPISSSDSWGINIALAIFPIVQYMLDVDEYNVDNKLHIFPNPSNGQFTIDLSKLSNSDINLEIINSSGNCILNQSIKKKEVSVSIDITDFPVGIYWVRLSDGQKSYSQKILKK